MPLGPDLGGPLVPRLHRPDPLKRTDTDAELLTILCVAQANDTVTFESSSAPGRQGADLVMAAHPGILVNVDDRRPSDTRQSSTYRFTIESSASATLDSLVTALNAGDSGQRYTVSANGDRYWLRLAEVESTPNAWVPYRSPLDLVVPLASGDVDRRRLASSLSAAFGRPIEHNSPLFLDGPVPESGVLVDFIDSGLCDTCTWQSIDLSGTVFTAVKDRARTSEAKRRLLASRQGTWSDDRFGTPRSDEERLASAKRRRAQLDQALARARAILPEGATVERARATLESVLTPADRAIIPTEVDPGAAAVERWLDDHAQALSPAASP